jgi:hypothetical protein
MNCSSCNNNSNSSNTIRDSTIHHINPLYHPLSNTDSESRYVPFEILDASLVVDEDGTILKSIDTQQPITNNPNVFAKLSSDNIHRRLINGSYIDGGNILKIDHDAHKYSKSDAIIQSEIKANNTNNSNIIDEIAIDPTRISVLPSFNSELPTFESGDNQYDTEKYVDGYKIQEYQSIYDDPNNSSSGYKFEDYKSIYE